MLPNDILLLLPNYFIMTNTIVYYLTTNKNFCVYLTNINYMCKLLGNVIKNNENYFNITKNSFFIKNIYHLHNVERVYVNYTKIIELIPSYNQLLKSGYNVKTYYTAGTLFKFLCIDDSSKCLSKDDQNYFRMIKKLLYDKYKWQISAYNDKNFNYLKITEASYNNIICIQIT